MGRFPSPKALEHVFKHYSKLSKTNYELQFHNVLSVGFFFLLRGKKISSRLLSLSTALRIYNIYVIYTSKQRVFSRIFFIMKNSLARLAMQGSGCC